MKARRKPPRWFKWTVWAGIVLAVAAPAACVMNHGELPGHGVMDALSP